MGIRNAVIENFAPLSNRNDGGAVWENFLIVERMKTQTYRRQGRNRYYWPGAELDYVEEHDGILRGFEFKFNKKIVSAPLTWTESYPEAFFKTINRDNYLDFLLEDEA